MSWDHLFKVVVVGSNALQMVMKLEVLLALVALAAAAPIANGGDGLLNDVLDLNIGGDK